MLLGLVIDLTILFGTDCNVSIVSKKHSQAQKVGIQCLIRLLILLTYLLI